MSLASRLYSLQVTDTQIRDAQRQFKEITRRLDHNDELAAAETDLAHQTDAFDDARKTQTQLEYQVEDLSAKIRDVNERLYGGTVRNTKELMGLEQDLQSLKRRREKQEELLLDAMGTSESLESSVREAQELVDRLSSEWQTEAARLRSERDALQVETARLQEQRAATRGEVGAESTRLYDTLVQSKAVAVVKVEGGRCKGCNLTVPTGQWQRARAGDIVQCPSCSRIIYVE